MSAYVCSNIKFCCTFSDVIFHTALDKYTEGLPPVVERCTTFLEYVNEAKCGKLICIICIFTLLPSYIITSVC